MPLGSADQAASLLRFCGSLHCDNRELTDQPILMSLQIVL